MMHRAIFRIVTVLLAALPALGADLTLGLGGEVEYDDNVFRVSRERDEEDDVLFRLRPGARVHEDRGDDLNFSLGYALPIEFSVDNSDRINDVDHTADGYFRYHVNDTTDVFGNDTFYYLRSTLPQQNVDTGAVTSGQGIPTISEQERDRVTLNDAALGMAHEFSPRLVGRLVASSDYFDSSREDRATTYSVGGTTDVHYALTRQHQVGGGGGYTFQNFDDRESIPGSETNIYNVFASWRWTVDETLALDVRAGPSYLDTRQNDADPFRTASSAPFIVLPALTNASRFFDDDGGFETNPVPAGSLLVPSFQVPGSGVNNCSFVDGKPVVSGCVLNTVLNADEEPAAISAVQNLTTVTNVNPAGSRDHSVTFFADATLSKRWTPTFASALRYVRRQDNASGLGGTAVLDAVSLSNTWDFLERWQIALRGDWTRRESTSDIEQTFDEATPISPAGSGVPLAFRSGSAFNSSRPADIDTQRWGVAARITHRLFRSTLLYGQVRYDQQESRSSTLGSSSDFDNILATFGVQHTFEPIKLW